MEDKFEKDFTKSEENLLEAFVQNCKSRKDDEVFNCELFGKNYSFKGIWGV